MSKLLFFTFVLEHSLLVIKVKVIILNFFKCHCYFMSRSNTYQGHGYNFITNKVSRFWELEQIILYWTSHSVHIIKVYWLVKLIMKPTLVEIQLRQKPIYATVVKQGTTQNFTFRCLQLSQDKISADFRVTVITVFRGPLYTFSSMQSNNPGTGFINCFQTLTLIIVNL